MEKTVEKGFFGKGNERDLMLHENPLEEKDQPPPVTLTTSIAIDAKNDQVACPMPEKVWLKGPLGMAICCGAPLVLVAAISLLGLSLGAIASRALSLAAILACPVGMYLMMRMMMKGKK